MNFHCSTAAVYIRVSDTIKPTDSFAHVCFSLSLEFLSMCGMHRSQTNAIKSTKPFSFSPLSRYILGINLGVHGILYVLMWP